MRSEKGVAIILALFVVMLASILVINLTYSNYLNARQADIQIKSLRAEYLLKSALNFARALIQYDQTPEDSLQDDWAKFIQGPAIDPSILGLNEPNTYLSLEITPEDSKLPILQLLNASNRQPDIKWRDTLERLFENLGFSNDQEVDTSGPFKGRHFKSQELVSMLIDYMDEDKTSYSSQGGFSDGFESELPKDFDFLNVDIRAVSELANVPGFTAARMQKLTPFISTLGRGTVNINFASPVVLKSLHRLMDDAQVEAIVNFRKSQPFTRDNMSSELPNLVGSHIYSGSGIDSINSMVTYDSKRFQVIAKVDYGNSAFYLRAIILKGNPQEPPKIKSLELF